jgi:hypothetical protein
MRQEQETARTDAAFQQRSPRDSKEHWPWKSLEHSP